MQRALLPGILASLGLFLVMRASIMALFEWEVKEINIAISSPYKVHLYASPWITELGESLEDGHYVLKNISVSTEQKACLNEEGLNIIVERSRRDKALELISISSSKIILWLMFGALLEIALSGVYVWLITDWHEHRTILGVFLFIATTMVVFCFLNEIFRVLSPRGVMEHFGQVTYDCYGALTLSAELLKIHYEMLIIMLAGVLGEIGAASILLRQFIMKVRQKKEDSSPAVG